RPKILSRTSLGLSRISSPPWARIDFAGICWEVLPDAGSLQATNRCVTHLLWLGPTGTISSSPGQVLVKGRNDEGEKKREGPSIAAPSPILGELGIGSVGKDPAVLTFSFMGKRRRRTHSSYKTSQVQGGLLRKKPVMSTSLSSPRQLD